VNKSFLRYSIGDSLPIIPPIQGHINAILGGTTEYRTVEIVLLGLGKGLATVEKITINAVIARCKPAYLPVVITAVRAFAYPGFPLSGLAGSTTAYSIIIIINRPIAKKLKINSSVCYLGPGAILYTNIVISRAIRLIQINIAF
jgi:hypothetical protein